MRIRQDFANHRGALGRLAALFAMSTLLVACAGPGSAQHDETTTVYFVRHAEPNVKDPDRPLTEKGRARAQKLVEHFQSTPVTHIYATHTNRTRDTVMPLAKARGLAVRQFPQPGSDLNGKVVGNRTAEPEATQPLIAAVRALPAGSTAVVAGHSTLYEVMAGLGVPVDASCTTKSDNCLPCASRDCFDTKAFNNVWRVVFRQGTQPTMSGTIYGE